MSAPQADEEKNTATKLDLARTCIGQLTTLEQFGQAEVDPVRRDSLRKRVLTLSND